MKKLLVLLILGAMLFAGCANKGNQTRNVPILPTANQSQPSLSAPPAQNNTAGQNVTPPPAQNNTPPSTNPPANTTADDQLKNGLDMFDFTVSPLMTDSGYGGTIPK